MESIIKITPNILKQDRYGDVIIRKHKIVFTRLAVAQLNLSKGSQFSLFIEIINKKGLTKSRLYYREEIRKIKRLGSYEYYEDDRKDLFKIEKITLSGRAIAYSYGILYELNRKGIFYNKFFIRKPENKNGRMRELSPIPPLPAPE